MLLEAIEDKTILKKDADQRFLEMGYVWMKVDMKSTEDFLSDHSRYVEHICEVPKIKRGSLAIFSGMKVSIVPTTVLKNAARIELYLKPITELSDKLDKMFHLLHNKKSWAFNQHTFMNWLESEIEDGWYELWTDKDTRPYWEGEEKPEEPTKSFARAWLFLNGSELMIKQFNG